jgi:orotidine-5'-phosphate decarboxylase
MRQPPELAGYVTDIPYVAGFKPMLAPAWLDFVALLGGKRPPARMGGFTWCDLGCGQGVTAAILAATHPAGVFHGVDAMTVSPCLGPSSLEPFLLAAETAQRGVVVLCRNSNLDSSLYQAVETPAGPVFMVVAASLSRWQERLAGGRTGWSSLAVTVAATHAGDSERIRGILPRALFLVLGYGAQGASAREAVRGFRRGPAGLERGIVSSSRPILFPSAPSDQGAQTWERGVRSARAGDERALGEAVA